ncbi:MAG: GAF domain-containing protein, partial [Candidatus Eremiobacterota bacterium]
MEKYKKEQEKKKITIQQALLKLSRFNYDSLEESFKMITETTSMVLGVELVSIWLYDAEQSTLTCHDSFKSSKNLHSNGIVIYENLYPVYFKTIKTEEIISVRNVFTEYKLSELLEAYIKPYGITSMMDVPVRRHGVICGVLCCEHTGHMRNWPQEEQDFVIAVSNLISLAIETHEKRKSEELLRLREKALEKARKELEARVKERTAELEKTNEMLKFENLMRQKTEQELHYRLSVEEILSSISGRFINITSDAIDRKIETSLKIIGEFLSIDRCYISILSYDGIITEVYEWCTEGISYLSGHYKNLNIETFPWYAEKLRNFEVINISSMDEFQGQEDEKKFFLSQGIKSFLTIPMYLGHELTGKFGLVSEKKEKKWNESD